MAAANVLVIKIAAMGDFLMATPALRALKQSPQVLRLILLAGQSLRPVVERNRSLDRVIYLDDALIYHGSFFQKAREVWRVARLLRREKIAVGFNFHRDWRFGLILFLAGIPRRIGFRRGRKSWLLTEAVAAEGINHEIFQYCWLLRALNIVCFDFRMEFVLAEEDLLAMRRKFLKPPGLKEFVALAPGGAANVKEKMESRRWPAVRYGELAEKLLQAGKKVIIIGGEQDRPIGQTISGRNPDVIDLTGRTLLVEAAGLLKLARVVVCNDSGLMHLAEAAGGRIISLFGPTRPEEKKPLSDGNVTLWKGEKLECAPCYKEGRFPACDRVRCLEAITVAEVFDQVQRFLD